MERLAGLRPIGLFLLRRLAFSLVTAFGVIVIVFVLVRILPGNPARLRAGPYASAHQVAQVASQLGLTSSILSQFRGYLSGVLTFNFGTSIQTGQAVGPAIAERLPATLELSLVALLIGVTTGIAIGALAARNEGRWLDRGARMLIVVGTSMPVFWLSIMLILFFYNGIHWAPAPLGRLPAGVDPPPHVTGLYMVDALLAGQLSTFLAALRVLILPGLALGFTLMAPIASVTRSGMLEALRSDYVRTARIVGVPDWKVMLSDCLRNAFLPIITTIGAAAGYLLGGNILVEEIFSFPGVGQYAWQALTYKDIDVLQGVVILYGVIYIALNVIVDMVYSLADPRVRLA